MLKTSTARFQGHSWALWAHLQEDTLAVGVALAMGAVQEGETCLIFCSGMHDIDRVYEALKLAETEQSRYVGRYCP